MELTSDTQVLVRMLTLSRKVAQIVGSMHWTLVDFALPRLARTPDHPVVVWPMSVRSRRPRKSADFIGDGLGNVLELRFPISSRYALLASWADARDETAPVVLGGKDVAEHFNAFTVAEAENQ